MKALLSHYRCCVGALPLFSLAIHPSSLSTLHYLHLSPPHSLYHLLSLSAALPLSISPAHSHPLTPPPPSPSLHFPISLSPSPYIPLSLSLSLSPSLPLSPSSSLPLPLSLSPAPAPTISPSARLPLSYSNLRLSGPSAEVTVTTGESVPTAVQLHWLRHRVWTISHPFLGSVPRSATSHAQLTGRCVLPVQIGVVMDGDGWMGGPHKMTSPYHPALSPSPISPYLALWPILCPLCLTLLPSPYHPPYDSFSGPL